MCGIVGVAGNTNAMVMRVFRDMHLMDTVRGIDASGVAIVPIGKQKPTLLKEVGAPTNLWEYDEVNFDNKGVIKGSPKLVIGHNRAATMGDLTEENAHPFEYNHIIGVHNGTLTDWDDINPDKEFNIDSKALIHSISKIGVEETWKSFRGAAAIVYWDKDRETLCMARNGERPMYICENSTKDVMFFASEPWMIRQAAARNKVSLSEEDGHSMRYLAIDVHYEFEVTATSCKMGEIKQLEKKLCNYTPHYLGRNNSQAGSTNYPEVKKSEVKKAGKKLNEYWATGTRVSAKETNNLTFRVQRELDSGYFLGKFTSPNFEDCPLHIVPKVEADVVSLRGLIGTTHLLRATARMRETNTYGGNVNYRCCMDHIEQVVIHLTPTEKPKAVDVDLKYTNHSGQKISLLRWQEMVRKPGTQVCDCTWCGNPLDPEEHASMRWLTKHNVCNEVLCPECAQDPATITYLSEYNLGV